MPEKREIRHSSYFRTDKKFREIIEGVLRDKKNCYDFLKSLEINPSYRSQLFLRYHFMYLYL